MPNVDSDWKCLIDEMWESYLCEENIESSSFYEPTVTDSFPNAHDVPYDQTYGLDENFSNYYADEHFLDYRESWEPFENLFGIMEEVSLFSGIEEKQTEKSATDSKGSSTEKIKTTKRKKANPTKDAETNTRKIKKALKSKPGEKRKRNSNKSKSSNQSVSNPKKK